MRLVLGTRSTKGLEVFRDVQAKVERREIEMHRQLRDQDGHHPSLFSESEIVAMQQNAAGVGCPAFQRSAEELIKELLTDKHRVAFHDIVREVLEDIPIRLTQIKSLVNQMKKRGVVAFDLPRRKRVPQPETSITLVDPDHEVR